MKTNDLKLIAYLLMAGLFYFACSDDVSIDNPKKIEIEDFSLYGTMCNWSNRENNGKIVIINSEEELKKYVTCSMNSEYHDIDFSKHSLLLAGSISSAGIYSIFEKNMEQVSSNKYELNVVVCLNEISEPLEWGIAIKTSKLNKDAVIELKIDELPASAKSVTGKWKFLKEKTSGFMSPVSEIDHSQHNIIFEFGTDGGLTITGNADAEWWPGIGEYSYAIDNYGVLEIDGLVFWYDISDKELILDSRPVDGSAFYFSKIE